MAPKGTISGILTCQYTTLFVVTGYLIYGWADIARLTFMANGSKQESQFKRWVFTLKKTPLLTHNGVIERLKELGFTKWCFQEERGANENEHGVAQEGGFLHYQGRASGRKPYRFAQLKAKSASLEFGFHWEIERDARASTMYVTKDATRVSGPWADTDPKPDYVPRKYRESFRLRRSQQWIVDRLTSQDDRSLLFVVDKRGATGKTTLGMYLSTREDAIRIPSSVGRSEDIMAIVMAKVTLHPERTYTVVLDIPRSVVTADHWGKWLSALEEIKNGHVFDKRYAWREQKFEPPRILVTANDRPPWQLLTRDRFDVVDMLWILFTCGEMDQAEYARLKKEQREQDAKRVFKKTRIHDDVEMESVASQETEDSGLVPETEFSEDLCA